VRMNTMLYFEFRGHVSIFGKEKSPLVCLEGDSNRAYGDFKAHIVTRLYLLWLSYLLVSLIEINSL
jgi:hypothetical protein